MPTSRSAAKRVRAAVKRHERNTAQKSGIRTQRRRVLEAIAAGNKPEAQTSFSRLVALYDKAVKKGILRLNTVSRSKSRIAGKINALPV
jgi:small subunit ribosomal protein S20